MKNFVIYVYIIHLCYVVSVDCRSFEVDYKKNCFLKDGEPFRYVSGEIHYFRVPHELWHDRIYKMKVAGLNAIQIYVEWSGHEPEPGVYNFDGNYDLLKFLKIAQDLNMLVILRPGPVIIAEREMGGLPYWLLRINPNMKLRTYDPSYIKYVDRWYKVLLPMVEPFLYINGGNIITVQVENEYGSTGMFDARYKTHLRDLFLKYLKNVTLFTTDSATNEVLICGKIDEVLSTIDFGTRGTNVTKNFNLLRWHQASGPIVNSEFYSGWFEHWSRPHETVDTGIFVDKLTEMLEANASVNIYMFHGGTNFGFSAGSNFDKDFETCPTSYDYDAPLSEAGDPTFKYYATRNVIGKYLPLPHDSVPNPAPKMMTEKITLQKKISLWDYMAITSSVVKSPYPLSFEDLFHPYGFVLYQTVVNFPTTDPAILKVKGLADRGYIYVNKVLQGILSREQKVYKLPVKAMKGDVIGIFVENQGRISNGKGIRDRKGILQNVTLDEKILLHWEMFPLKLDDESLAKLWDMEPSDPNDIKVPAFYFENFILSNETIYDTFLRVDGWHKGVAFLNNFNMGRYWPIVGPQITLYAPGVLFEKPPKFNRMILFELEHAPCDKMQTCTIQFVKDPKINGTTPKS